MPPKLPAQQPVIVNVFRGRGALTNTQSRFHAEDRELDRDELDRTLAFADDDEPARVATQVTHQQARTIISRNNSPDIPFDQSINPYQGCEHGCIYCYARPTHAYLGLSPGLDFETKLFAKTNAASLLRQELSRRAYVPTVVALGANTDPYQPIERELGLTRSVLEVLSECHHPVAITTKSALVTRDLDILGPMAQKGLVRVMISVTTLDAELARKLEPRANSPERRLDAVRRLAAAGVPTGVIVAPIIPALNDGHLEQILERAAEVGASDAAYVLLRLPLEIRDLFVQWLEQHFPLRAKHVMSLVNQMRGGHDNDSTFGLRMRGTGLFADLLAQRFKLAARRHGLNERRSRLDASRFVPPTAQEGQRDLFDG